LLERIRALLPTQPLSAAALTVDATQLVAAVRAHVQHAWRSSTGADPTADDEREVLGMMLPGARACL
jgi:hypothetical protein